MHELVYVCTSLVDVYVYDYAICLTLFHLKFLKFAFLIYLPSI